MSNTVNPNAKKKVLAISGSTRLHSTNESILKVISTLYSETLDVQIFAELANLPHFNPDLDKENVPSPVVKFRNQIEQADGVIICTPEYVFSIPGALKNALEWMVSTVLLSDKPAAFIVASSAGEKAYESLLLIMNTLQVKMSINSTLLIQGVRSKVNSQGEFLDNTARKEVETVMESFIESMNKTKQ